MASYVGTIAPSGDHVVYVVDGEEKQRLAHHAKHSPDGFSWGYAGSGPAELARCLLLDALGDAAVCPTCKGTGKLPPELNDGEAGASCWTCDGGYLLEPGVYQDFKDQVVAQLPMDEPWRLPRALVESWLAAQAVADERDAEWWTVAGVLIDVPEEARP